MSLDVFSPLDIPRLAGPAEHAERERARRRGHALGYAEGMAAAREQAARDAEHAAAERRVRDDEARAAAATALAALHRAAAAYAERADAIAALSEERVMGLAVELAETILQRDLADPVRRALTALTRARQSVDPSDQAVIVLNWQDLTTLDHLGENPAPHRCESSAELAPGDAQVRLPDGEIDLRVQAALARARAALTEELG